MKQASDLFNDDQRKRVEKTVVEAEAGTSCEIVPVVATASGRYDRPEDMVGLWLAGLTTFFLWILFSQNKPDSGSWSGIPLHIQLLTLVISIVVMFTIGVLAATQIGWLRRWFTPRQQMLEEVSLKAKQVFFDKRIHHTTGATGLLIYVSVFEHTAMILGDQQILDHPQLGQSFLDDLCKQLTGLMRDGDPTEALCAVIKEAGQKLSGPLPRSEDDVNELHDTLILIDD